MPAALRCLLHGSPRACINNSNDCHSNAVGIVCVRNRIFTLHHHLLTYYATSNTRQEALCGPVVCALSVIIYFTRRVISVFSGEILMKLGTNIHIMRVDTDDKVFKVRGQ